MVLDSESKITYVLSNGYEMTVSLCREKLGELLNWYNDNDSTNSFDINDSTTLFKNALLAVKY